MEAVVPRITNSSRSRVAGRHAGTTPRIVAPCRPATRWVLAAERRSGGGGCACRACSASRSVLTGRPLAPGRSPPPRCPRARRPFEALGGAPLARANTPIQNAWLAARVADHYHSASEHGIIGRRIDTVVADRRAVGGALAGHGSHEVCVEEGVAAWRR